MNICVHINRLFYFVQYGISDTGCSCYDSINIINVNDGGTD